MKNVKNSIKIACLTSAFFLVSCVTPVTEYEICGTKDCAEPVDVVVE